MNILISSLGLYWNIVEEALGLFNYAHYDFYASKLTKNCDSRRVFMSLACGRKTMSTDIQDAAYCFGSEKEKIQYQNFYTMYSKSRKN